MDFNKKNITEIGEYFAKIYKDNIKCIESILSTMTKITLKSGREIIIINENNRISTINFLPNDNIFIDSNNSFSISKEKKFENNILNNLYCNLSSIFSTTKPFYYFGEEILTTLKNENNRVKASLSFKIIDLESNPEFNCESRVYIDGTEFYQKYGIEFGLFNKANELLEVIRSFYGKENFELNEILKAFYIKLKLDNYLQEYHEKVREITGAEDLLLKYRK